MPGLRPENGPINEVNHGKTDSYPGPTPQAYPPFVPKIRTKAAVKICSVSRALAVERDFMSSEDPQEIWNDYYQRKKAQRLEEAVELSELMQHAGITEETVLVFDFVHFGTSKENIEALAKQLSEDYSMQISSSNKEGYWVAKGTTRPYGITLNQEEHWGGLGIYGGCCTLLCLRFFFMEN